jgi:hypothetical protein
MARKDRYVVTKVLLILEAPKANVTEDGPATLA